MSIFYLVLVVPIFLRNSCAGVTHFKAHAVVTHTRTHTVLQRPGNPAPTGKTTGFTRPLPITGPGITSRDFIVEVTEVTHPVDKADHLILRNKS